MSIGAQVSLVCDVVIKNSFRKPVCQEGTEMFTLLSHPHKLTLLEEPARKAQHNHCHLSFFTSKAVSYRLKPESTSEEEMVLITTVTVTLALIADS